MKDDIITIQNNGPIVDMTNYYDTAQAKRGEVYLTWNAGCARLLVPSAQRHLIQDMKCDHVVITKKKEGVMIMFDDLSDAPFVLVIAHEQNDRDITEGDCLFSVYIKLGEKYQFPCKCIVEHGNKGNANAKKQKPKESQIQMRVLTTKKAAYVKQAQREGKKLTDWMLEKADAALDDDLL